MCFGITDIYTITATDEPDQASILSISYELLDTLIN